MNQTMKSKTLHRLCAVVFSLWLALPLSAEMVAVRAEDVVQRIADSYVPWQENSFPGLLGNVAAGRIANRVMQTSHAVRESVVSGIRAVWYIVAYGLSALALMAHSDWRLAVPTALLPLAGTFFNYRKTTIYGGSNEVQRNIVAQTVLG